MEQSISGSIKKGWELEKKHIFVLSSSGKPIFSRYGDEQDLVTTFGLLQAVISIAVDSGDYIRCIRAGDRNIVYMLRGSLYFVSISSTNEPEIVLLKQLHFIYQQILLVLTSKVHEVFRSNPSSDIRQLLGPDTTRLMHAACDDELAPTSVVFESIDSVIMPDKLRDDIVEYLKFCVEKSSAALGVLLWKSKLVGCMPNSETQLKLGTPDILLLSHFVTQSNSLRTNDQHWVPICMPGFNANGYLQAYICSFTVAATAALDNTFVGRDIGGQQLQQQALREADFTLILVAGSADSELFKELMRGKRYLEKSLQQDAMAARILHAVHNNQGAILDRYLESSRSLHFMYKLHSVARTSAKERATESLPAQSVQSTMRFPLDQRSTQQSIWTTYQRLAVCLRRGSCSVESTILSGTQQQSLQPQSSNPALSPFSGSSSSTKRSGLDSSCPSTAQQEEILHLFTAAKAGQRAGGQTAGGIQMPSYRTGRFGVLSVAQNDEVLAHVEEGDTLDSRGIETGSSLHDGAGGSTSTGVVESSDRAGAGAQNDEEEAALRILSEPPSSDHALAYYVLASGLIVVALASYDSELFVTFPGMISPLDACTTADTLSRTLKADSPNLFQTSLG